MDEWERIGQASPADRSGALGLTRSDGSYRCATCDIVLFDGRAAFEFGTGSWPKFIEPVCADNIEIRDRQAATLAGYEVCCAGCGGHLGQLFTDRPGRTAERYCIERDAIRFADVYL
jgi:peptide-methionine (R)-S-oxide reductase